MPISPEYRRENHEAELLRAKLEQHLPEQQKELLDCYTEAMYLLGTVYAEDAYARGFALGLRLACEALSN